MTAKGDIRIKDGKIVAVGQAGKPDTLDSVHPQLIILGASAGVHKGANLNSHAGGGIDTHIHFICPQRGGSSVIIPAVYGA